MRNLLQDWFCESVRNSPEAAAIEAKGETLSYAALHALSGKIADTLKKQSIQNQAVLVFNDADLFTYAGILAVSFSGNTLLPLELSWPAHRITDIIQLAKPACVLASLKNKAVRRLIGEVPALKHLVRIDEDLNVVVPAAYKHEERRVYEDVAYILFTSGSTGVPKGVPVKTENLNAFLRFFKSSCDINSKDRFLQVYDLTFDVAYFSFFVPLCAGACVCLLDQKEGIPKYLCIINDLLKRNITVVSMVPTVLGFAQKFLKENTAPTVRYSFFSGDVLYHSEALRWQQFVPNAQIHNYYGLTETTIVCTKYVWDKDGSSAEAYNDRVPIGQPFDNMDFRIVDEALNDVPPGATGQLVFTGAQVIDQYLNQVNSDRFFYAADGKRKFYKTGDLVSVNEKGNLLFHGRIDHQVKVNGYRIELEEIQQAIRNATGRKNVVVKKGAEKQQPVLCAYVEGTALDTAAVREKLEHLLPHYMIPAEFIVLPQLPISENGKTDIRYLQGI